MLVAVAVYSLAQVQVGDMAIAERRLCARWMLKLCCSGDDVGPWTDVER